MARPVTDMRNCEICKRYGPPHDGSPCGWCGRREHVGVMTAWRSGVLDLIGALAPGVVPWGA